MIPVIMGILIALFINSWNEQRKDRNYITKIIQSIGQELTESKKAIAKDMPDQNSLVDTLRHYLADKDISIFAIAQKVGGFNAPQIRTNSWVAISRTKIELIDYDYLKVLTDIEDGKNLLNEKLSFLMNFVYSNMRGSSEEIKETLILLLQDIIGTEKSIKQKIEDFENLVGSE